MLVIAVRYYFCFKVSVNIKDEDFPEGSKRSAKNFCRNPKNLFSLPWCYALDLDVIDEECNVPICTQDGKYKYVCIVY